MKIILSLVIGMLMILQSISAQQIHNIKGYVRDATNNLPVEFATITLLKADSTVVNGVSSDETGSFSVIVPDDNKYIVLVSYLGYNTRYEELSSSNLENPINIKLQPSSVALNEVTISAQSVINKTDRKLLLPSQMHLKSSTDGLDLLRKMQLSRIMVDPISGEVTMSGNGEVQLRKNGVEVTTTEIISIKPEDIVHIEYYDDPGVRYGNASAVIDYITRRNELGGNVRASLMNSLGNKKTSADDLLAFKYNNKKSEFSANVFFQKRKQDWTREYDEKFVYPNYELHRLEIGEPTEFNKSKLSSNLNYGLAEKDKYFLNVQFRYTYQDFPSGYEDRRGKIYTSGSDVPLSVYDHTKEKTNSPALDLYFQRNFKDGQQLIFNMVGTYIGTKNTRIYQEVRDNTIGTDIFSNVSGDKYSLIVESIYEKKGRERKTNRRSETYAGLYRQPLYRNCLFGSINDSGGELCLCRISVEDRKMGVYG